MEMLQNTVLAWPADELDFALRELAKEYPRARVSVIRDVLKQVTGQVSPQLGFTRLMGTARLHLRSFSGTSVEA